MVKVNTGGLGGANGVDTSGTGVGVTGRSGKIVVNVTVTDSPGPPGSVAVKVSVTDGTGDTGATGEVDAGGSGQIVISVGPLGGVTMTGDSTGAEETGGAGGGGGGMADVGGKGTRLLGRSVNVLPGASVIVRVGPDKGVVAGAGGAGGGTVLTPCGGIGAVMVISCGGCPSGPGMV